jgi:hypothetical protein
MLVKVVAEKKRQPAVVNAVEMAQKNRVEPFGAESGAFHRQKRRRSAVEEKKPLAALHEISAVVPAAAAESVAASENMEFHRAPPASIYLSAPPLSM